MKRFQWAIAMLLAVVAQCAYADSIPTFNITQVTVSVGINNGSGENIFFSLTGPGTNISGDAGIGCFDWCSFNNFSPGDSLSPNVGQMFISLFHSALLGGITYNPDSEIGFTSNFSLNVLGSIIFPANFNGSTFCVPASMPSSISGQAGSDQTFIQFNLKMPPGGNFCTTWNFNGGQYQFVQGKFVATTVPEPGTLGFMVVGLASLVGVIRMQTRMRATPK
jgi:hypothetical protein